MKSGFIALAMMFVLSACASMPGVTVGYYLPKASVEVTLVQTATCTDGNVPILKNDLAVNTSYSSDRSALQTIDVRALGGRWSKTNASFEFYEDGRLKGVNTVQTGQAAEVTKSLLSVVAGAKGLLSATSDRSASCDALRALAGSRPQDSTLSGTGEPSSSSASKEQGEPKSSSALTLVFRGRLELPDGASTSTATVFNTARPIQLEQNSIPHVSYLQVEPIFGSKEGVYTLRAAPDAPHSWNDKNDVDAQALTLVQAATAEITIVVATEGTYGAKDELKGGASIPQVGRTYKLPIQRAPLFGENQFELSVSESGRVTKIRYSGGGGAEGAVGAVGGFLGAIDSTPPSTADQAKAVQAEADLIYQQQRLVLCQATPSSCPK